MEKDEKIQLVHSKRTRVLALVSLTICLAVFLGSLFVGPSSPELATTAQDSITASLRLRKSRNGGGADNRNQPAIPKGPTLVDGTALRRQQQQQGQPAPQNEESEEVLAQRVADYDQHVRAVKKRVEDQGGFMETDTEGVVAAQALQEATRKLLKKRYGAREPYRVQVDLEFQPSNPTYATDGPHDSFVLEMAPSQLVPHSVFSFLEIVRHWRAHGGAFHRRANHVLQVMTRGHEVPHLAFQEYSAEFPHAKGTVGYAGRPSGPAWYVSILDNTRNHGPGTQQARNPHEADSCFGKVVEGFERVVLGRIAQMPGMGFLKPPLHVKITNMTILVPSSSSSSSGDFVPWVPTPPAAAAKTQ